jgi:DNA polymerase bacteriophage-type
LTARNNWRSRFVPETYDRSQETLERVGAYCLQDVRTEIALSEAIDPLSLYERRVWELDQRINQRGLRIDIDYVHACLDIVAQASRPLAAKFAELTRGLKVTQTKKLIIWCNENGLGIDSLAKDNLKALGITGLAADQEEDNDTRVQGLAGLCEVPPRVRRVLEIRAVLGSASIAKLHAVLASVNSDGRVRYTQQYHGAGTGRTAGRLFQPTNFPRGKIEGGHDPAELVALIRTRSAKNVGDRFGDPIAAVASGLRHVLIPADNTEFNVGDFVGVEARIVLALAGQHDKTALMAAGQNPYLDFGALMFGHLIDKNNLAEYQPAKAGVLGCGFQCGADNFNIKFLGGKNLPLAERVVDTYRKVWAPQVPKLWKGLEQASLVAVQMKGETEAYGIKYRWYGGNPDRLACILPDGQIMWYMDVRNCLRPMPWDASVVRPGWCYKAMKAGQWKTVYAYGGLETENVVQKIARGFLVEACFRLEANNLPLVLTVYDECMSEVPLDRSDHKAYGQIMAVPTRYSQEIKVPISVESWAGPRYRKA